MDMTSPSPSDAERLAEMERRILNTGTDWKSDEYAEDVPYLLDRVKAAEAENNRLFLEGLRAVAGESALVDRALLRLEAAEARIHEQEAEISRLTAAGLAAEVKWADEVEKRREQGEVIQALRETKRPICSCVPQDPDCPARAFSSATDGEVKEENGG